MAQVWAQAASAFVALVGRERWEGRLGELRAAGSGRHVCRLTRERYAVELSLDLLRRERPAAPTAGERTVACLATAALRVCAGLSASGRDRFHARLAAGLSGSGSLMPLFHLLHTAERHRARGFCVEHAGLAAGAPFDLLLTREGVAAELAADVLSAEEGRDVPRAAWFRLADRIDPDLQRWLAAHPGRYLLKMTLPRGLAEAGTAGDPLADLHRRIGALLASRGRADHDSAAILRLDPLLLAGAQAEELGLLSSLRREFGPEAHLAVTTAGGGVFVMAARAAREDEVAAALRRRLEALAPARLTGERPGILAMLLEDTDRGEWCRLRERLELEGEARLFLTRPQARPVVAVSCASRLEMFAATDPAAAPEGELRFRNPAHPAARLPALAPAVLSAA